MKVHKKKLKSLKIDAVSESRQGALVAASANLVVVKYTLDAAKAKLAAVRTSRSKGKFSNSSLLAAAN